MAFKTKKNKDGSISVVYDNSPEESLDYDYAPVRDDNGRVTIVRTANSNTASQAKDDDRKWFEKGFFEDGYQFGDLGKTLLSTSQDITENLYAGIVGMGEKIVDAGAYAVGGVAGLFGGDGVKDKMQEFIAKDLYDEKAVAKKLVAWSSPTGIVDDLGVVDMYDTDEGSFLGEKSEGLVQSAGQLGATVALQSVGVPWYLTSGVTSFGGEVENAFNQGATYGQAGVSAAITAGAELLTEKLFKGSGLGEKGLINTSKITANITSRILKTFADFGVDMASEGIEEMASGWLSALGQNLTYADDKTISELFSSEDAFESFVGGALLSGGMNAGKTVRSVKTGRDYNTGFTANEEKVVKKEVENRIAEAEKGGKKLTDEQKAEIRDSVETALKRGEISTDTIESVLGGEDYKAYQSILEKEKPLRAEMDDIMRNDSLTDEQKETLVNSVKAKLETLATETDKAGVRSKLDDIMKNTLKRTDGKRTQTDDYLIESYNEVERSKHAFEVDLSDKKGLEKENLQAIMDKKLINNTRRTHDFWEWAAKATAERGQKLTITTTEEIIEMEVQKRVSGGMSEADARQAVKEQFDGVRPNGYKLEDGTIALNVKSGGLDARRFILGHEIGHDLESHGEYDTLKELLKEYDKTKTSKEAHAKRKTDTEGRYKNVEDAEADNELTNDLIGQYIYGDEDFVRHLSVKNPNIFKRIWNKVKYLYKMATAGSQEQRDLLRIQNVFEKVYRESAQNKTEGKKGKTDYSLTGINKDGIEVYETSKDVLDLTWDERKAKYLDVMKNEYRGRTAKFERNGHTYYAEFDQRSIRKPIYGDNRSSKEGTKALIKAGADGDVFDLVENAKYNGGKKNTKDHTDADYFDYFVKTVQIDGKVFDLVADVEKKYGVDGGFVYTLALRDNKKIKASPTHGSSQSEPVKSVGNASNGILSQKESDVKTQFSLSSDSDGKQLSPEQQDYFKDSKMRDEDGNLKVMYHGSRDAGFHVFDPAHSDDATSLFFVDRNDVAASYSGTTETYEAQSIRTAEDMNKFMESIGAEGYEVVEKDGKFTLLYEGDRVADSNTAQGIYEEFCWYEGVGDGDANYKVYLNLTNPLEVDAEGRNWNNISREFSQELYDRYQSLTAEEKAALTNLAEWEDVRIFRYEIRHALANTETGEAGAYDKDFAWNVRHAYEKLGGNKVNMYDLFSIASDNFSEESLNEFAVNQMNTRDYAAKAKAEGYDGVIFKNIVDVGGYSNGSEGASTVAIAFDSNQIKSVANDKPTRNADIRFSLSEAVEETPDLIAAHNLSSDNLLKSLKLGGLPMPSVAITRADGVHNDYGDISVILRKSAIDPKANRDNKIYSGDAWTPVYPTIEYKPNDEITRKIGEKYYELARKHGYDDVRPLYRFANDTEDALKRDKGEQGLLNALYDDTSMMQVYLLDKGLGKVETIQDEIRTEMSDVEVAQHEFFIKELGADVVDGVMFNGEGSLATHRKQYWENHGEQIKETYKKLLTEEYGFTEEEVQNVFNAMKTFDFLKLVRNAHLYRKNGRVTVKTEPNREATNKAIREKAADGYKEWVDGLFKGIEEKTGIRNNRDYFTPSGNRRSWDALHWENTLENVVRVMKEQGNGENTFFTGHGIWGAAANEYKSIEDVKADSDRLKRLPKEEYEAIRGDIGTRLQDVAQRIMDKSESNQFIAADNALACIVDAVRHSRTADGILKELKQYRQLTVTEADAKEIVSIVADIAKMPTEYFEAKPRRAVGFDEVGVFVIPRNADVKLKQELLNRGYAIAEYDPDVEGDRQKVVNSFEEYKFSLSDANAEPISFKDDVPMSDSLIRTDDVAPVKAVDNVVDNSVAEAAPVVDEAVAPVAEMPSEPNSQDLYAEKEDLENRIREAMAANDQENAVPLIERYQELIREIKQMEADESERLHSLSDADVPPETEAPYYGESEAVSVDDPFESRDIDSVGNRKVKAYMFENPEVKPFFQEEAQRLLGELERTEKPQTIYLGDYKYKLSYDAAKDLPELYRTSRQTTEDIAYLRDSLNMSYADIEKGIKAIIEDNGAENIAAAKKIEFILNDRLMNGYNAEGVQVPPDQDYLNLLNEKQIIEYNDEARKKFFEVADEYAPPEDIAPVAEKYEAMKPKQSKEPSLTRVTADDIAPTFETKNADQLKGQQTMFDEGSEDSGKTAEVLTEEPETEKKKSRGWSKFKTNFLDKGAVFEDLSLKTKNRELMGKWNHTLSSESRAQWLIGNGTDGVKSLNEIRAEVEDTGLTKDFYEYLYHKHNVDRMSIEGKAEAKLNNLQGKFDGLKLEQIKAIAAKEITDKTTERTAQWTRDAKEYLNALEAKNKPVFGDSVTAEVSQEAVNEYEKKHPEFKALAQDVYDYTNHLRSLMVENGVISQETADLWAEMYPNYVPVRRAGHEGAAVTVPLDTGRTGVNAPIKRATGGNSDILPLFDTLALRTEQTFKAIARNSFGVELKNTLGTTVESNTANLDEIIDSIDTHEELLKKGEKGKNPTFTVFEDGKRVEFEITEDMYDALKPTSDGLKYKNKVLGTATKIQRGLLTEYNPVFMATNAIKDVQDILVNSQHAAKTYANLPSAIKEMVTKGKWYQEYMENGGEQNTYFDSENKTFTKDDTGIKKLIGIPLRGISAANNFIERLPRLAEYIASRKSGASVEVAMLDAARVTTNFAAGGDVTKFLDRNGATFLNASVQGFNQQVRNIREAKANGLKGWAQLAAKFAVAGLPAVLLNHLMWDDDEEYEELSDYVKDNYYVVAKMDDGTFVRIPKGRALAVIQNAMEQISNAATGDDEVDLESFLELAISNLAPNNPLDSNIFAPIMQVANNETWYGEDLVPTRLQDLPDAEQYDESTDSISKWLGEKLDYSPYKINYLLNQYSGGVGDVFLPMLTPEAESGDNSFGGNIIAPFKDKFSTDSVMNNQNISDFYDTVDELAKNANSMYATDADALSYKYMNSISSDIGELYQKKREIQNSYLSDAEKYEAVREIQDQINALARESLATYGNVNIDGGYATVGDLHYRWYEPSEDSDAEAGWQKITDKQLEKQEKVTGKLGISASEYWSNKEEYDYAYDYPEKYAVAKSVGGYKAFRTYASELYDIKADKDEDGKSISGSRKEKVIDYVNSLDIDYGMRIILFKSEYNADDTYNYDILDYLNSRNDISYEEMATILKELGFTVHSNGRVTW